MDPAFLDSSCAFQHFETPVCYWLILGTTHLCICYKVLFYIPPSPCYYFNSQRLGKNKDVFSSCLRLRSKYRSPDNLMSLFLLTCNALETTKSHNTTWDLNVR